jgi:hypothetical protein
MSRIKQALVALSLQRPFTNLASHALKRKKAKLKFTGSFIGFFAVIALLFVAPVAGLAQNLNSINYVEKNLPASLPTRDYGYAVKISGDTAVVASYSGNKRVYVFVRSGSSWIEQARLTPSDYNGGVFGESVAIHKDTTGYTVFVGKKSIHVYPRVRFEQRKSRQPPECFSNGPESG